MSEPTEIAIAVVEFEGRFLVGERPPGAPLAGFWEFPGGKVEPGESPRQAAARECREETGIEVVVGEAYPETVHTYDHGTVRLHFFRATPSEFALPANDRFVWATREDLREYPFPPANEGLLNLLCAEPGEQQPAEHDLKFWLGPVQVITLLVFAGLVGGLGRQPPATTYLLVGAVGLALIGMSVVHYFLTRSAWSVQQLYFDTTALAVTGVFAHALGWPIFLAWIPLLLLRRL